MSQTVTQNSVLSQNWVKCTVCTPMAQAARWAGLIVAPQAPCCRPPPAVSWPSIQLCRSAHRPCHRPYRELCHAPTRAAACRVAASSVLVKCLLTVSWRMPGRVAALYRHTSSGQTFLLSRYKRLYRDTPQRPSYFLVTILLIVSRHNPHQPGH